MQQGHEYGLSLSPHERRCADRFFILAGALHRHYGDDGDLMHMPGVKLQALLEYQALTGRSSSPLLEVWGLTRHSPAEAEYFATTLTGKRVPVRASASTPIAEFKYLIQKAEGIPPEQQGLIFRGMQLEDGKTLGHYGIKPQDAVHLVLRLRGGMWHPTSGRLDNSEISKELLTETRVTVVVPGHGEVQVTVPLTRNFTGKDLMHAAQQAAAQQAAGAAARPAMPQRPMLDANEWPSLQDSNTQRRQQQRQQQHNHSSNRTRKPRQQ